MTESQKLDILLNQMEAMQTQLGAVQSNMETMQSNMVMKEDLKNFATKEDLKNFATKEDLKNFATKEDLKNFATKEDLKNFATKADLRNLQNEILEELDTVQEKTNHHFKRLEQRFDKLERTVHVIRHDSGTIIFLVEAVAELQKDVRDLKSKVL